MFMYWCPNANFSKKYFYCLNSRGFLCSTNKEFELAFDIFTY